MNQTNLSNDELNDDNFAVLRQLLDDLDFEDRGGIEIEIIEDYPKNHITVHFQGDDEHLTDDIVDEEDTEREQNYEADDQEDSA